VQRIASGGVTSTYPHPKSLRDFDSSASAKASADQIHTQTRRSFSVGGPQGGGGIAFFDLAHSQSEWRFRIMRDAKLGHFGDQPVDSLTSTQKCRNRPAASFQQQSPFQSEF